MTVQIRRSDYADYWSHLDALCEPIGVARLRVVWDEDEGVWMLDQEGGDSNHDGSPPQPDCDGLGGADSAATKPEVQGD